MISLLCVYYNLYGTNASEMGGWGIEVPSNYAQLTPLNCSVQQTFGHGGWYLPTFAWVSASILCRTSLSFHSSVPSQQSQTPSLTRLDGMMATLASLKVKTREIWRRFWHFIFKIWKQKQRFEAVTLFFVFVYLFASLLKKSGLVLFIFVLFTWQIQNKLYYKW